MGGIKVSIPLSPVVGLLTAEELADRIYSEEWDKNDEFIKDMRQRIPEEMKELVRNRRNHSEV